MRTLRVRVPHRRSGSLGPEVEAIPTADFASAGGELGFQTPVGCGALIAARGASVPMDLGTPALSIEWSGPGVRVETPRGTLAGRAVIVTVSTGVLAEGGIRFVPDLPAAGSGAIADLPTGTENKIGVRFDRDVFGPDGRGHFTAWNNDGTAVMIDASVMGFDPAVVFVGGEAAFDLERAGPAAMRAFALDRLADIFGSAIRRHAGRSLATAWSLEPLMRGSWACARPGRAFQRARLAGPLADRLFFAGEAALYGGQGFCHGAHDSGLRAAREVAAVLAGGGSGPRARGVGPAFRP